MNSFVVILSCLAAVAIASPTQDVHVEYLSNGNIRCRSNCRSNNPLADCPPVNCPPAVRDGNCGLPDCSLPGNRLRLHPTPDPNFFFQCVPNGPVGPLVPQRRPCACGTLFSAVKDENRCVHPEEWVRDCPSQPSNPILSRDYCRAECPDCGDNPPVGVPTTTNAPWTPAPTTTTPWNPAPTTTTPWAPPPTIEVTNAPPGGNCPCVCFPCIWWPCQPCGNSCPCQNQNQQQPQQPQNPWQPPQNQNPWQPPQQPQQPQWPQPW